MGPSRAITFLGILPALVFIITLNLSRLVLNGLTRDAILAYGHLWNAMFLAFPLAHVGDVGHDREPVPEVGIASSDEPELS